MAISDEQRVERAMQKYVDYFGIGLPFGFEDTELENPNNPDEWEKVLDEAIEYNEPFNYCCEGVFTDDEIAEQERLRASRKSRIAKAKSKLQGN